MSKAKQSKPEDQAPKYEEVLATLETRKGELAERQEELKEFKTENEIKSPKRIKDKNVLKKYNGLIEEIQDFKDDIVKLKAQCKELKPKGQGGFGAKYDYKSMQVKDKDSGEMREMTKQEKKRWRTKARRLASKDGVAPETVKFDPNFLAPKPKKKEEPKDDSETAKKPVKKVAKTATAEVDD